MAIVTHCKCQVSQKKVEGKGSDEGGDTYLEPTTREKQNWSYIQWVAGSHLNAEVM